MMRWLLFLAVTSKALCDDVPADAELLTTLFESLNDLIEYFGSAVYLTGNRTGVVDSGELESITSPIFEAVTAAGGECPEGAFKVEFCLRVGVCMLEDGEVPADALVKLVEMVDLVPGMMEKFDEVLLEYEGLEGMPSDCTDVSFLDEFSAASERQWKAISTTTAIQEASKLFQQATAAGKMTAENFQDIWHPSCALLGCDSASFLDILHTLNGHTAELLDVRAPMYALRYHVSAMRKFELSVSKMDTHALEEMTTLFEGESTHAEEMRRYDQRLQASKADLKKDRGVLLQAQGGFWEEFVVWLAETILRCFSVSAIVAIAYGKLPHIMIKPPVFGIAMSMITVVTSGYKLLSGVSFPMESVIEQLKNLISGGEFCLPLPFNLIFSFILGFIEPKPSGPGANILNKLGPGIVLRIGMSIALGLQFPTGSCEHNTHLTISLGVIGLAAIAYAKCIFGAQMRYYVGGPVTLIFACLRGYALGLTILCCKINLSTGENDCAGGGGGINWEYVENRRLMKAEALRTGIASAGYTRIGRQHNGNGNAQPVYSCYRKAGASKAGGNSLTCGWSLPTENNGRKAGDSRNHTPQHAADIRAQQEAYLDKWVDDKEDEWEIDEAASTAGTALSEWNNGARGLRVNGNDLDETDACASGKWMGCEGSDTTTTTTCYTHYTCPAYSCQRRITCFQPSASDMRMRGWNLGIKEKGHLTVDTTWTGGESRCTDAQKAARFCSDDIGLANYESGLYNKMYPGPIYPPGWQGSGGADMGTNFVRAGGQGGHMSHLGLHMRNR